MDLTERADELFRRSTAGDADGFVALCADGCVFRQNGGPNGGTDGLRALVGGIAAAGVRVAYSDVRRIVTDDVVVEQHVVTLTRPDGVSGSTDVCVVMRFDADGMLVQAEEYLDSAAFASVLG